MNIYDERACKLYYHLISENQSQNLEIERRIKYIKF